MLVLVIAVATVVVAAAAEQPTVMVTLKQGTILGSPVESPNGFAYYRFNTIPYAKPPVGPLRLKDPEPAPAWSGVRNGSLPFPMCPQSSVFNINNYSVKGQEDCLYLSVFTPRPYESNLPVMVYIHGGALVAGSALGIVPAMLPGPLVDKGVVVVAMNYRLGTLGFLSTDDSVLPGNMGFKDQTLALRWVQDNIRDLGGDPKRVTIFGISAGGFSCHFHVLSPISAGLFQRAILQSSTALFAGYFAPDIWKSAVAISKALNCTGEESQQLLACFMKASVEDLVKAQNSINDWYDLPLPVAPRVDGTLLPDSPAALLKSGRYNKVDMMIGWTKDDSDIVTAGLFSKKGEKALRDLNDNFQKVGPILAQVLGEENADYLARRIFFTYMNDLNVTLDDEPALTSLAKDCAFEMPGIQSAELHAKNSNNKTFVYRLEHHLERSRFSIYTNTFVQRKMVGHSDDARLLFQFPPPFGPLTRPQDLHVRDIMATLWTNFAYTGNPTINGKLGFKWTPVTPKQPFRYLSITTTPTMQRVDEQKQDFWKSLPTKISKVLYPERFLPDQEECEPSLPLSLTPTSHSAPDTCITEEF